MKYSDLQIGVTVAEVVCNWMDLGDRLDGARGWLRPFGFDVHQGLEFFWMPGVRPELWVVLGPSMARPAAPAEENNVLEAIELGALEIYHRGTWSDCADRRWPKVVAHAATGSCLAQYRLPVEIGASLYL